MLSKTIAVASGIVITGTITACAANAEPPSFPDLSKYSSVNAAEYTIELPNTGGPSIPMVYFVTPDGITCEFSSPNAVCTGNNFPGVTSPTQPSSGGPRVNAIGTDRGLRTTTDPISTDPNRPYKALPPMHSITVDGTTCVVDAARMTACRNGRGEGFTLSPSWSGWSAHIG